MELRSVFRFEEELPTRLKSILQALMNRCLSGHRNVCRAECLEDFLAGQMIAILPLHETVIVTSDTDVAAGAKTEFYNSVIAFDAFCIDLTAAAFEHCCDIHVRDRLLYNELAIAPKT